MQTLTLKLIVEYRNNENLTKADKSRIEKRFQEVFLNLDREELFRATAEYAGYNALLEGRD